MHFELRRRDRLQSDPWQLGRGRVEVGERSELVCKLRGLVLLLGGGGGRFLGGGGLLLAVNRVVLEVSEDFF